MTHFFLMLKQNTESKKTTQKLQKISKKKKDEKVVYYPYVTFINDLTPLLGKMKNTDVIEVHCHGSPFGLGNEFNDCNDYSAISLAKEFENSLNDEGFKKLKLSIELHTCNSGTFVYNDNNIICFAKDLSQALHTLGFSNITVTGYTGYLLAKNNFNQSILGEGDRHDSKVPHCKLEEGTCIFKNGIQTTKPKKIMVKNYIFDNYEFEKYTNEKEIFYKISSDNIKEITNPTNKKEHFQLENKYQSILSLFSELTLNKKKDELEENCKSLNSNTKKIPTISLL